MKDGNADKEGFLGRWSRRKRKHDPAEDQKQSAEVQAEPGAEPPFADFDFEALDFSSDYRRFMVGDVPDDVRNRALAKLWSSSDLIGQPDELDDYLEDFREAAKALPSDLARSAYRVGRGFIDEAEEDAQTDASTLPAEENTPPARAGTKQENS